MKRFLDVLRLRPKFAAPAVQSSVPEALVAAAVVEAERAPAHPDPVRSVLTRIGDREYRIASDDKYLDHINGEFEPETVRVLSSLLREGDCVLDIGANIGCTAILFSRAAGRVISFEPSPTTFRFLQDNLRCAGADNVVAVNLGLGKAEGEFELAFSAENRSGGFVSDRIDAASGLQTEKIRIAGGDQYLRDALVHHVDFIKIDVEGFEQNVIEGLKETIEHCRPVVALELNHWCLNVFQRTSVPDFLDFLRGVFPVLVAVDGADVRDLHDKDDAYHVMYHHIVSNFRYSNLVGTFDQARLSGLKTVIA